MAAAAGSMFALRRLQQEFRQLLDNPTEGLVAGPRSEDNFWLWDATVMGPEDSVYEFGCFRATLEFPPDYPMSPPKMKFVSPVWHPNIYNAGARAGEVCISILHPPGDDAFGYESSCERWSPVQSVEKILLSVISMLAEPNTESPANIDAAKMWRDSPSTFAKVVKRNVEASLGLR